MANLYKKSIIKLLGFYLLVGLFFLVFNPNNLPLIMYVVPFVLVFILIYQTTNLLLDVFFSFKPKQKRIIQLVISIMPVVMLVIQSITQLTLRDVVLCLAITTIMVWYGARVYADAT